MKNGLHLPLETSRTQPISGAASFAPTRFAELLLDRLLNAPIRPQKFRAGLLSRRVRCVNDGGSVRCTRLIRGIWRLYPNDRAQFCRWTCSFTNGAAVIVYFVRHITALR
jgi:hypothetical protein